MPDKADDVTQADREAAAEFFFAAGWHGKGGSIKAGKRDDEPLVQAFARHREEAERRTVDWLRAEYDRMMADAKYLHSHGSGAANELFDKAAHNYRILTALERGDHALSANEGAGA